ncbi:hypothetical protein OIV83_005321 [Microbotryomycetes sp. JL201]|nr:hypothetical protein OIV83_005321 [Microbotryomycetes sp. JL201]
MSRRVVSQADPLWRTRLLERRRSGWPGLADTVRTSKGALRPLARLIPNRHVELSEATPPLDMPDALSDLDYLNSVAQAERQGPARDDGTRASDSDVSNILNEGSTVSALSAASIASRVAPGSDLAPLLASLQATLRDVSVQDIDSLDDEAVEQLLKRMEDADQAAQGLEGRLDHLLGEIDSMLDVLEPAQESAQEPGDRERNVAQPAPDRADV